MFKLLYLEVKLLLKKSKKVNNNLNIHLLKNSNNYTKNLNKRNKNNSNC